MIYVDADEIATNLWQGSYPEPGDDVARSGFKVLVMCATENQDPATSYPGVEMIYAPNYDDGVHTLTRDRLRVALKAARRVAAAVKDGRKTLVTCQAGLNRSGLVVGLALHLLYNWPGAQCVTLIRARRRPTGRLIPLFNEDFVQALNRLEPVSPGQSPGLAMEASCRPGVRGLARS